MSTSACSQTLACTLLVASLAALVGCGDDSRASTKPPAMTAAKSDATVPVPKAGHQRKLKDTPFERSWDLQLPKPVLSSWISPNIPELIFFQVRDTYEIYAIDAFSGHTKWVTPKFPKSARVLPGVSRVATPAAKGEQAGFDDRLWVISDDTLYSFDAIFGEIVWRWQLPFSPSTTPLALGPNGNQRIFIGDHTNRMQVVTYHAEKSFPYIAWQMNIQQKISAAPVEHEGLVYAADESGVVRCFKYDREEVWAYATGAPIFGSPLTRGRLLYAGNQDNALYALNRLSGERLGALFLNGPIRRAPFAFKAEANRVYAWVDPTDPKNPDDQALAGLYAIKSQSDNVAFTDNTKHPLEVERLGQEWMLPGVDRLVCSTPEHLFVTSQRNPEVMAVNRTTGKVDWSWNVNEDHKAYLNDKGKPEPREIAYISQYQDPSDLNRSIYTVDTTGHVIAYRVNGDKPGDPSTGDKVVVNKPAVPTTEKAADAPAAEKAEKAEKPAPKAKPAAADK